MTFYYGQQWRRYHEQIIYEEALAAFIRRREAMFEDRNTFWGRNRVTLIDLDKIANFPDAAYWHIPDDPLVLFPDWLPRPALLKRKYLNRLRQMFMKRKRQRRL